MTEREKNKTQPQHMHVPQCTFTHATVFIKIKAEPDLKKTKPKKPNMVIPADTTSLGQQGKGEEQGQARPPIQTRLTVSLHLYNLNRCTKFINGNIYPHFIFIHTYIHISIYLIFFFLSG